MNCLKKLVINLLIVVIIVVGIGPITISNAATKELNFAKVTKESESADLHDIVYNKDKTYVAVGDEGSIITSSDANSWVRIPLKTTSTLNSVVTNGKDFVAVGNDGIILKSVNGKSWSKGSVKFTKDHTYKKITGKLKSYVEDEFIVDWNKIPKQSELELRDVLWDGKKYVAIGHWQIETGSLRNTNKYSSRKQTTLYSDLLLTSKDGLNWSVHYTGVSDLERIIYTGKKYIATSNKKIAFSTDLKKWKVTSPKLRGEIYDITYANNKYTIIGWDGSLSSMAGTIYNSTDGIKWVQVFNKENLGSLTHTVDDTYKKFGKSNGFSNLYMRSVIWDGQQYVIAGNTGMVLKSGSGTNWKKVNSTWAVTVIPLAYSDTAGAEANIEKIIYDGHQYIMVGGKGTILVSTDLKKGIVTRSRPPVEYQNIAYDGEDRYFAHGQEGGGLWESNNGYNWKKVSLDMIDAEFSIENVIAHKGTAIVITREKVDRVSYGDSSYYYSDKPGSWTKMKFPTKFTYTYGAQYFKGKFHLYTADGLISSKDGKKWSGYTMKNPELKNIVDNGKIYIGQKAINVHVISDNTLYTSKNLKKWSKVIVKKDGTKYNLSAEKLIWNGKQFVTIGGKIHTLNDGNNSMDIIAFSSDGIKWDLKDSKYYFVQGAYGNKTYVAVDYFGNLYTSTNGIDYSKVKSPTKQKLNTALWDGKKFIVAGDMGVIITSITNNNMKLPVQDKWVEENNSYTLTY